MLQYANQPPDTGKEMKMDPYEKGKSAWRKGISLIDNPYQPRGEMWQLWRDGWFDAE